MAYVRCPNCDDTMQDFRNLESGAESAAAEQVLRPTLRKGEVFVAAAYQRCARDGCRRVQRKDNWKVGATLPEEW
ncbi:hypothetical protein ACIHAR_38150 [Streptomyces sp. NPDC052016]|jgi:hypothetical protein|uniref:hypothetical protein n=1 Tax=unclassified Streptomyces TaxID=2593676 RepID=UPI00342C37BF